MTTCEICGCEEAGFHYPWCTHPDAPVMRHLLVPQPQEQQPGDVRQVVEKLARLPQVLDMVNTAVSNLEARGHDAHVRRASVETLKALRGYFKRLPGDIEALTSLSAPSGWQPIAEAQVRCERVANGLETALTFPSRLLLDTAVRESIKELRTLPTTPDTVAPSDWQQRAVTLLKDLRTFIEYARYELEPKLVSGSQFPSQECADKRLAKIDETLKCAPQEPTS